MLESPFWQSFIGSLLANAIFAVLMSAIVISFGRRLVKIAWTRRVTIRLWLSIPLIFYVALLAIRFNTGSANENTIKSLQASVEALNAQLTPRQLTEAQRQALILALADMPTGSTEMFVNIGDHEALGYELSLQDVLTKAKWNVTPRGSTPWPYPGLFIVVAKRDSIPPDAANLAKAFLKSNIYFRYTDQNFGTSNGWALIVGTKP
jgi:hypothetical protein